MKTKLLFIIFAFWFVSCGQSGDEDLPPGDNVPELPGEDPGNASSVTVLIEDDLEGEKVILAGNQAQNFIVSYKRVLDGTELQFVSSDKNPPVIMEDTEGNQWDIFGYAVEGPRKGQQLTPTKSLMGYWFSFGTFYPGIQIYPDSDRGDFAGEKITGSGDWLVPANQVRAGGPGKDGIPAVSNPSFTTFSLGDHLGSVELVIGFRVGDEIRGYPHSVLDWHEIVNDKIDNTAFSVIYCPLTGTGTVWNASIDGQETTFGVSGLLYNSNIIPYDRRTDSNWSQLFDKSINGTLIGTRPENFQVVETTYATWRKMFPTSKVMTHNTGFARNYDRYPYGGYKSAEELIFPVEFLDNRLHPKERVHVVIVNDKAKAYRFKSFQE